MTKEAARSRTLAEHWASIKWPMVGFQGACHVLAAVGLFYVPTCQWKTWLFAAVLAEFSILGVTAGVHRLWTHKSYQAHWTVRLFLMLCFSVSNQGAIVEWVRDHRIHHKYSETDADPHTASRGLFFAHIGWLLTKEHPKFTEACKTTSCDDLLDDWVVQLQLAGSPYSDLVCSFVFPTLVAYYGWNEDILHALLVAGCVRYVFILHCTCLVNSVAHFYGSTPYDPNIHPTENRWVALLTVGEGWHNWHHTFPYDYACSELGAKGQYNPSKMFIDACAAIGLVTGRKRALHAWQTKQHKLYAQHEAKQF
ncbi:hypothetical protein SPRG_02285 [Saprolegnia parasitica CBS 223.65]|uniref:Fatty acid desaturase domain-containing protein n=1 Tax=Saprolegnia parasitica (strain CBS 223.65) TaxID=695850 RepID=A0A067D363_SAPPC|nr:hypothetical protein SPRG_02285 [Saprolegnia parasitica CBS 223.65]KDO33477.1 hypothetical protein SPRG_02285 [Saprolegnia parasitica CBS 223.65]|eukprot:XP_012196221.1 hypothetical protein SPRG_02285 [Saprolegnia parasitica CBS 223.65]